MKKSNLITTCMLSLAILISATGCQSAAQKDKAAKEKVEQAKIDLAKAQDEANTTGKTVADANEWAAFKAEAETTIQANKVEINRLNEKMKSSGKMMDAAYEKRIDSYEEENNSLQARLDAYEKDQSDWASFKREFSYDMDELGHSIKDLGVNNQN